MVRLRIPRILESRCSGKSELSFQCTTLRQVLAEIEIEHPELFRCVCTEAGRPRMHIHFFSHDGRKLGLSELDKTLAANEQISVFQAVSGG